MRISVFIVFMTMTMGVYAQKYKVGTTTALWKVPASTDFSQARSVGLEYVEVAFNQCYRGVPANEVIPRVRDMKAKIDSAGIKVWSIHLPFSRTLDISVLDEKKRKENVDFMAEMIEQCAQFQPKCLVLHPSSEPIADEDRAKRLLNSHVSIGELATVAKEIDAFICVENLPRTCLGQTGQEMMQLIDGYDEVFLCFDTNHLFYQSHSDYLKAIPKGKIKTLHLSDYDFVNESHLPPGQGKINWQELLKGIKENGYDGVMMFECDASPEEMLDCLSLR